MNLSLLAERNRWITLKQESAPALPARSADYGIRFLFSISLLARLGRDLGAVRRPVVDEIEECRCDLKRHLVADGQQRHRLALQHFDVVVPGIDLDAAAQR